MSQTSTERPLFALQQPIRIEPGVDLTHIRVEPVIANQTKLAETLAASLTSTVYEALVEEHERRVPGVRVPYTEDHVRNGLETFYRGSSADLLGGTIEGFLWGKVYLESLGRPDAEY